MPRKVGLAEPPVFDLDADDAGSQDESADAGDNDNEEVKTCADCLQLVTAFDADLLPEQHEQLKWRTWKKTADGQIRKGTECYWCWATRRKYYKRTSAKQLRKQRQESATIDAEWKDRRRKKARGDDRYEREEQPKKMRTKDKEGTSEEGFVEGHFYSVDSFLRLHKVNVRLLPTLKAKVRYIKEELKETVVRNKAGEHGVEVNQLPTGASYKFRRGAYSKNEFEVVNELDISDESEVEGELQAIEDKQKAALELEPRAVAATVPERQKTSLTKCSAPSSSDDDCCSIAPGPKAIGVAHAKRSGRSEAEASSVASVSGVSGIGIPRKRMREKTRSGDHTSLLEQPSKCESQVRFHMRFLRQRFLVGLRPTHAHGGGRGVGNGNEEQGPRHLQSPGARRENAKLEGGRRNSRRVHVSCSIAKPTRSQDTLR